MNLKQCLVSVCLAAAGLAHAADEPTPGPFDTTTVADASAAARVAAVPTPVLASDAGDTTNYLLLFAGMVGMAAIGWARRRSMD